MVMYLFLHVFPLSYLCILFIMHLNMSSGPGAPAVCGAGGRGRPGAAHVVQTQEKKSCSLWIIKVTRLVVIDRFQSLSGETPLGRHGGGRAAEGVSGPVVAALPGAAHLPQLRPNPAQCPGGGSEERWVQHEPAPQPAVSEGTDLTDRSVLRSVSRSLLLCSGHFPFVVTFAPTGTLPHSRRRETKQTSCTNTLVNKRVPVSADLLTIVYLFLTLRKHSHNVKNIRNI